MLKIDMKFIETLKAMKVFLELGKFSVDIDSFLGVKIFDAKIIKFFDSNWAQKGINFDSKRFWLFKAQKMKTIFLCHSL